MKKLNKEKLEKLLRERMTKEIEFAKLSGGEILVFQHGERMVHVLEGYKNAVEEIPLRGNEMYRLASMSKPVCAVAALIGVQRGWFALEDEVEKYLPQFADMQVAAFDKDGNIVIDHKAKTKLKIWHMLSHTSGIMSETELGNAIFDLTPMEAFASMEAAVDYVASQPLAFEPTTYTAYTGYASFDAVARILEMKSGMNYEEFITENIFKPLGITDITFHPTEEQWERMVPLHDRAIGNTFVITDMGRCIFEGFPLSYTCAGAGLAGSIEDYAKFALMILNNGTYNGVKILEPEMIAEMKKPRIPDEIQGREKNDSWGLGVRVKVHEDWLPEGVFGWSGAYGTHFYVDQTNDITALYLRGSRWYDSHGGGEMANQFERDIMSCLE